MDGLINTLTVASRKRTLAMQRALFTYSTDAADPIVIDELVVVPKLLIL
jgi:hypothetical protein